MNTRAWSSRLLRTLTLFALLVLLSPPPSLSAQQESPTTRSRLVSSAVIQHSDVSSPIRSHAENGSYTISGRVTDDSSNPVSGVTIAASLTYTTCHPADVICDCRINLADIEAVADHWRCADGDDCYESQYDLNDDGRVDVVDMEWVAHLWDCSCGDECYGDGLSAASSGLAREGSAALWTVSDESVEAGASAVYTTTTSLDGTYTLGGLPEGIYTLVPSQDGSTFSPATRFVPVPPDMSDQDFTKDTGGGPVPDGMVIVPAGEFLMGCDDSNPNEDCEPDELPLHTVYLDEYAIDEYEVTNAQYAEFLNAEGNQYEGGSTWLEAGADDVRIHESGGVWQADAGYHDHPVVRVTWYGARAYCQWQGKRLPTEAEWEKAARGDSDTRTYPWGNEDPDCERLNYEHYNGYSYVDCVGDTVPVGSYPSGASPYGALDMAGNAWEWVNDWYDSDYYASSPYSNPQGPESGSYKPVRGGAWSTDSMNIRIAVRSYNYLNPPYWTYRSFGLRCVYVAPGE